jgi:hypothetical protein
MIDGGVGGVKRALLTQPGWSASHMRDIALCASLISTGIFLHIIIQHRSFSFKKLSKVQYLHEVHEKS